MEFFNIEMQSELMAIKCNSKKDARRCAKERKKTRGKKQSITKKTIWIVEDKYVG